MRERKGESNRPILTKELETRKGDETLAGEKPEANPNDEPRGEAKGPGTEAFTPSQGEETSTGDPLPPCLTEGSHQA